MNHNPSKTSSNPTSKIPVSKIPVSKISVSKISVTKIEANKTNASKIRNPKGKDVRVKAHKEPALNKQLSSSSKNQSGRKKGKTLDKDRYQNRPLTSGSQANSKFNNQSSNKSEEMSLQNPKARTGNEIKTSSTATAKDQSIATLVLFNKPFKVMSQFSQTEDTNKETLANYIDIKDVYPAGRLDFDSEGLLALTDNGILNQYIANPSQNKSKTYLVQVEGQIDHQALKSLSKGVELKDGLTKPAKAKIIEAPQVWDRNPPIRERAQIPTSWIELTIAEGKNRQVRRMTAAVGFPTLRLIRSKVSDWSIDDLKPGEYRVLRIPMDTIDYQAPARPSGRNKGKPGSGRQNRPNFKSSKPRTSKNNQKKPLRNTQKRSTNK